MFWTVSKIEKIFIFALQKFKSRAYLYYKMLGFFQTMDYLIILSMFHNMLWEPEYLVMHYTENVVCKSA